MDLNNLLGFVYERLTNVIAPPYCSYCRRFIASRTIFCPSCFKDIEPIVSYKLSLSKKRYVTVHAMSAYENPLKKLILQKNNQNPLTASQLGMLLAQQEALKNCIFDYIIPVPLHWTRYAWRGFNQAEVMGDQLSKNLKIPLIKAVARKKRTIFQSDCSGKNREDNVAQAFKVTQEASKLKNKHILIVDDLMTSGATLKAMAKILIPFGPSSITAIVACRVNK